MPPTVASPSVLSERAAEAAAEDPHPRPGPYPRGLLRGCSEGQRRGAPAASDPGSESHLASCPRRAASSSVCVARCSAPRARPGPLPVRTAETNASAGERRPPLAPRTPRVAAADVCAAPPPVPGGCARLRCVAHRRFVLEF